MLDRRTFLKSLASLSGPILLDTSGLSFTGLAFGAGVMPQAHQETMQAGTLERKIRLPNQPVGGTFCVEIAGQRTREFPYDAPLEEVRREISAIAPDYCRVKIDGGHLRIVFVGPK